MITFKKKNFAAPALAALGSTLGSNAAMNTIGALGIGTSVAGMVQSSKQMKEQSAQAEEQMAEQKRLQNQQLKEQAKQNQRMMDTLKDVAKKNPTVAGAAAGQQMGLMQGNFSMPAKLVNAAKLAKGSIKDFAAVGKQMGAHKHLATSFAIGSVAAAGSYLTDKAIQADAKRSGIDLGESDNNGRKESLKKIGKAAGVVGTAALATLGAKKGMFGKSIQGSANKYLTKANAGKVGNTVKNAFKNQFVNTDKFKAATTFKDKVKSINGTSIGITGGLAALPAISYMTNKKALKEQSDATRQAKEEQQRSYAAININTMKTEVGNFFKNRAASIKNSYKGIKTSFNNFKKMPVRNTLGGISSFLGGGGKEGTAKFTEALKQRGATSGNKLTQGAADFLGKHKTLAVAGSIGVGLAAMKPFELGHSAVKTATKAIDKNATRYEDSTNKTVE